MYDALIVGGRPAGSATALLLARKGYRVLLVEKASVPGDVPRGHFIHVTGVAHLKKWGLLEKLIATNCPPVHRIAFHPGPFTLVGVVPPADGIDVSYAPRHRVIDALLHEAAQEAGAETRDNFLVSELLFEGERVIGIRGRNAAGQTVTEHARVVIGADGLHSTVARAVQAPMYRETPTLSVAYFAYYRGISISDATLYALEDSLVGMFPTNDDLVCALIQFPYQQFHEFRQDVEGNFAKIFARVPELAELLHTGTREGHMLASSDQPNFFRRPYGPGWALVGDAGYHKDPYTGQGFSDAFLCAELLTEALDAGFSEKMLMEDALADYERQRNEHVMPMFEFTCQLASFAPPSPEMQQLFAALQSNPEETSRFLGTLAGTVLIPEFFHPDNVGRIIASARTPELEKAV